MTNTGKHGEVSNSFVRGVGVALVIALAGLMLVGFSFNRHNRDSFMGPSYNNRYSTQVCTPPQNLPGATLAINTIDMGMMMGGNRAMALQLSTSRIVAGQVNVVVHNVGRRTHEVVILPLEDGQVAGERVVGTDGRIDETGSLGEVSNNCASGAGEGIYSGSMGWATFTLKPGRYELVCNLRNHYAAGMYQELVVTA